LFTLRAVLLASLGVACGSTSALAQEWGFTNQIACAQAPVYGVGFNRCWVSSPRSFRVGNVQAWRLVYTDAKSEVAVGLYKLVEAHGVGGISPVAPNGMADWLRSAEALQNVTAGASGWASAGGQYVSFQKPNRQCIGFVRNGTIVGGGQVNWILGATFCRESATPIAPSEAQFIADAVRVRE
jgi:hypothetical protein